MHLNDSVRDLYERFPYPTADDDLAPLLEGKSRPAWNPRDSFALYFPDRAPTERLDVLIAGCGTNTAQQHAAYLPAMRFVAIDVSESSLAQARRVAEKYALSNIEFVKLAIEDVERLGCTFDFVSCHGVLHHLEDPAAGLRALGRVTRPDGALSLMVYGRYGRTGIYMLQELFRDRLRLELSHGNIARVQAALTMLPDEHPLRMAHRNLRQALSIAEIADMLMHPRDRPYTTDGVRALVEASGLEFHRWLGQAAYSPAVSPLAGGRFPEFDAMDTWAQSAAMELFYGTILKHEFVVAPPGRRRPADLFAGERLWEAVPAFSAHLAIANKGSEITLTNSRHQVPYRVTFNGFTEFSLIKRIDGRQAVAGIVAQAVEASEWNAPRERALETFRQLYLADMIDLKSPNVSGAA